MCTHPINPIGIHLLCCAHDGNKCTKTHDVIHDIFAAIAQVYVSFHMGQEKLHVFPSTTSNSFGWQIDIVLTKKIHTQADVVVVDPTWVDLLPQFCTIQGFVASDVVQAKEMGCHDQHLTNQFLPLIIKVFGCLHK
jgi:hypothetical protein